MPANDYGWESITPVQHDPPELAGLRKRACDAWQSYYRAVDRATDYGMSHGECEGYYNLMSVAESQEREAKRLEAQYHRMYAEFYKPKPTI